MDTFTTELFQHLFSPQADSFPLSEEEQAQIASAYQMARQQDLTQPILELFATLLDLRRQKGVTPAHVGISHEQLQELAQQHKTLDEHGVTVGGRLRQALPLVENANARVADYRARNPEEAPSGLELWERIRENIARIHTVLKIDPQEWDSFAGQLRSAIDSVDTLAQVLDLPATVIRDVLRVTQTYRMRLTPYYASLIQPGVLNDPVLLQSVPTAEMVDNIGEEMPPVAADHSPARLVDQFYPQVVTIKVTNICAMYCTHCLRLAHIGKQDRIYPKDAYQEALTYIRQNRLIRDVLITGGDAFMLPNSMLRWLLSELDDIDHVRLKRLGTRIPVTAPMRIDAELLDILAESNRKKPVRVVTQINTAQEITPISKAGFQKLSANVSAVLNQAVLLKGINDTRIKMWKLCETIQEAYVRPYYLFNCSYRNPQFAHLRVPVEVGRDIVESMYGNISGDAIPRYICTAGGKVPMHRENVIGRDNGAVILRKPWSGEDVRYPDADPDRYHHTDFAFRGYVHDEVSDT